MTVTQARRLQALLSVAFLLVIGVVSIVKTSLLFLICGSAVLLFISANLWFHKKAYKLTREIWIEYLIVGLMVLLLAYSAAR
jgi:hypothetical protein